MQPRAGKGPSWVNEPQPQSQTSVKVVERVDPRGDQMDPDPAPPQGVLSDLEWMRQRMAKSVDDDSDMTAPRPEPQPQGMSDISQVRLCS